MGWLVGGFAAFGLAVWSAAWPFRETGNRLARLYHRFFHYALVVPVILLAVGVGVRIAEYGITEKRYALILLTLWLGGIALYGILARPARLAVAPAAFAAMLIAGAAGPWGATSISIRSQLSQLESMLAEAGILVDGKIDPQRRRGRSSGGQTDQQHRALPAPRRPPRRLFRPGWKAAGAKPAGGEDNEALLALMGLDYVEEWEDDNSFSYSVGEPATVDITGFDIAHNLSFGDGGASEIGAGDAARVTRSPGTASRCPSPRSAARQTGSASTSAPWPKALRLLELDYDDPESIRAMTLEASENGLRARLYIEYMSGRRTSRGNEVTYGHGLLLIGRAE